MNVPEMKKMSLDEMRVVVDLRLVAFQMTGTMTTPDGTPIPVPDEDKPPTDAMILLEVDHVGGADAWDAPKVSRFILDPGMVPLMLAKGVAAARTASELDRGRN